MQKRGNKFEANIWVGSAVAHGFGKTLILVV